MKKLFKSIVVMVATSVLSFSAVADNDLADQGRELASKYQNAMVSVEGVLHINMSVEGRGNKEIDTPFVVQGAILNADGLILSSFNSIDATVLNPIQKQQGIEIHRVGQITELRIRYADGKEVDATMVMKDPDMDVALIMPVEKVKVAAHINTASTAEIKLFDQVISLARGPAEINYTTLLTLGRVSGVVEIPSQQYLVNTTVGAPVFSVDGKLAGFGLLRTDSKGGRLAPVVYPAKDVMGIVNQLKE